MRTSSSLQAEGVINGNTLLVPHIGYPTGTFRAPMIYNPWFEQRGIDARVVPFAVTADDYPAVLGALRGMRNVRGALITMPHKLATVALVDVASTAVQVAGSCNAVLRRDDGTLAGDMFDGIGFTRALARHDVAVRGARCLLAGAGGVGSAFAAALAAEAVGTLVLHDVDAAAAEALAGRVRRHYPAVDVRVGSNDPAGYDIVVNATPLGMKPDDALPFEPARLAASTFVGEVVLKQEITPLLAAARARGCRYQVGTDMLFEMIPAYIEFFGFGSASAGELRALARIRY
jgi:shikimate dehydrogenase